MRYPLSGYPNIAKKIITEHSLQNYVDVLLDYWQENPTTLGHGFEHVLKAAVECYELAKDNEYSSPVELFIAGLFHDVYRPAEGKDAKEEHHKETGRILRKLFKDNDLDNIILKKLLKNTDEQDNWRHGDDEPSDFDLFLFIGERAAHGTLMADAYAWASNKYCKENKLPLAYRDHLDTMNAIAQYQPPVWKIFKKYKDLKGIGHSIEGYIEIFTNAAEKYQQDPRGEKFSDYLEQQAHKCRQLEEEYLQSFNKSPKEIQLIMKNMY